MRLLIALLTVICLTASLGRAHDCSRPFSPQIAHLVRLKCTVDIHFQEFSTFDCAPGYEYRSSRKNNKTLETFNGAISPNVHIECVPIGCLADDMPVKLEPGRDKNLRYFKSFCKRALLENRCSPEVSYVEYKCKPGYHASSKANLVSRCSHDFEWTQPSICRPNGDKFDYDGVRESEDERLDKNLFSAIMLIQASQLRSAANQKSSSPHDGEAGKLQVLFKRLLAIQKLSEINKKYATTTPAPVLLREESAKDFETYDAAVEDDEKKLSVVHKQPEKLDHYKFFEKASMPGKTTTKAPTSAKKQAPDASSTTTAASLEGQESQAVETEAGQSIPPTDLTEEARSTALSLDSSAASAASEAGLDQTLSDSETSSTPEPQVVQEDAGVQNTSESSTTAQMLTKQNEDYLEQMLQEAIESLKSQNINYMDMIDSILSLQTSEQQQHDNPEPETERQRGVDSGKRAIEDDLAKITTSWDNVDLKTLLLTPTANATSAKGEQANEEEQNFITASTLSLLRSLPNDLEQMNIADELELDESLTPEQKQLLAELWQRSKRSIYRNLRRQRLNSGGKKKNKNKTKTPKKMPGEEQH